MAGYSGTPLAKKLGIKSGHRVLLVRPPRGFAKTLEPLPEQVSLSSRRSGRSLFDVVVFFTHESAELKKRLPVLQKCLQENGGLWVAWPKKVSGVATDLSFEVVQPLGLSTGWVDNKICAVSDVYSGLRFVKRLKDRKAVVKRR